MQVTVNEQLTKRLKEHKKIHEVRQCGNSTACPRAMRCALVNEEVRREEEDKQEKDAEEGESDHETMRRTTQARTAQVDCVPTAEKEEENAKERSEKNEREAAKRKHERTARVERKHSALREWTLVSVR